MTPGGGLAGDVDERKVVLDDVRGNGFHHFHDAGVIVARRIEVPRSREKAKEMARHFIAARVALPLPAGVFCTAGKNERSWRKRLIKYYHVNEARVLHE